MSPSIETELREALAQASESIQPSVDLADRVRNATRRQRRALTSTIVIGLVVVTVGCLIAFYAHGATKQHSATNRHHRRPSGWQMITVYGTPSIVAVSGRQLYVAVDGHSDSSLIAYDLMTGKLIRRVSVPAVPSTLRIGPGGLVWLGFYPDNFGGRTGVWLLSPDLRLRSGLHLGVKRFVGVTPFDVLPTGADTAVLAAAGQGLARLRLPMPGRPGVATVRWGPRTPASHRILGLPIQVAAFAGRVAVRVASDDAHGLITFAGPRQPTFTPNPADGVRSMAVADRDLWITIFARNGDASRGLIRLDPRLQPATPGVIRRDRLLAGAQSVAVLGGTVWVVLSGSPGLACFTDRDGLIGAVATVATHQPLAPSLAWAGNSLAVAGSTIYVLTSVGIDSYRVPAACR